MYHRTLYNLHPRTCRTALLQRRGAIVNMTGDEATLSAASSAISGFLSALPETAASKADWAGCLPMVNEALTVPTQVKHTAPLQVDCVGVVGGLPATSSYSL